MTLWYNLRRGITNLIRWFPVIWQDRDWDHAYIQRILEAKLRFVAAATEHWTVARANRSKKELLICAELLKRMQTSFGECGLPLGQDWEEANGRALSDNTEEWLKQIGIPHQPKWPYWKHWEAIEQHNLDLLTKILNRKLRTWWN